MIDVAKILQYRNATYNAAQAAGPDARQHLVDATRASSVKSLDSLQDAWFALDLAQRQSLPQWRSDFEDLEVWADIAEPIDDYTVHNWSSTKGSWRDHVEKPIVLGSGDFGPEEHALISSIDGVRGMPHGALFQAATLQNQIEAIGGPVSYSVADGLAAYTEAATEFAIEAGTQSAKAAAEVAAELAGAIVEGAAAGFDIEKEALIKDVEAAALWGLLAAAGGTALYFGYKSTRKGRRA